MNQSDLMRSRLISIGSSDAFNSGARCNSCFWVEDEHGAYLLDCGPTTPLGLQRLLERKQMDFSLLDTVYLTHLHGDHFGGLPVLLLELNFVQARTEPLLIAGPKGTEARVKHLCDVMYPTLWSELLKFEVRFQEWERRSENMIGGRQLKSIPAIHDESANPTSIRIQTENLHIVFSGDTGWSDELCGLSEGAQALVLECSFSEAVFPGHLSLEEISQNRSNLKSELLILTHFGVAAREKALRKQDDLGIEIADDGREWTFRQG